MKILLLTFVLIAGVFSAPQVDLKAEFVKYQKQFNKKYLSPEEETKRFALFSSTYKLIEEHNKAYDARKETFEMGLNKFSDMTTDEFKRYMGLKIPAERTKGATFMPPSNIGNLPTSVDWRTKGYVTPVKDQGNCGSCWAFSATGSLEGQHFKKNGTLVSLSEQNLVDCVTADDGCGGGIMDDAFDYIKKNKGVDTEKSYPYTAMDGRCKYKAKNKGASDVGRTDIKHKSEPDLQQAVATVGPISVAINAASQQFMSYRSGLFKIKHCPGGMKNLDHGVLVVGYGTMNNTAIDKQHNVTGDYWIVKNSWNTGWGMDGYIYMARNFNNMCGIATMASYPNV